MTPPPIGKLSILQHLISSYKVWHELKNHIPKNARYTLGEKIDRYFIDTLELLFFAQYAQKGQKLPALQKANTKFDTLKFFLQILWETKNFSAKHYELISVQFNEIGKMLGGWLKKLALEATPPKKVAT